MEELKEFIKEVGETIDYSKHAVILSEKYGDTLYKVQIKGVYTLWLDTLKVLTKWEILELHAKQKDEYEIVIGF